MSKGQSLIFQFVMFFMVGFIMFVTVGTFFKMQSDIFQDDVTTYSLDLSVNYIASAAISQVESCKGCQYASYIIKLPNSTAGYISEVTLSNADGVKVRAVPGVKQSVSAINGLKDSVTLSGSAPSVQPINLTFSRTKNELRVE